MRRILTWPDDRLRQVTQPIEAINDSVYELFHDLILAMHAEHGLGVAAPQIGDSRQMFVIDRSLIGLATRWGLAAIPFINPEVIWTSPQTQDGEEGCLSFPDVYVNVRRPQRARVRALGLDGHPFEIAGDGLLARCLLHESDHLTGRLLADYMR